MYQSGDHASVFDIGSGAHAASSSTADAKASIVFPDGHVLFNADFRRSGTDLLLVEGEASATIVDYFRSERRLGIATPDGAGLTGATVEALVGSGPGVEYAQAGSQAVRAAAALVPIGRVEKVSGSATVLRNGSLVELRLGDTVARGDVVQTGADSSLIIRFHDGTVFSLSASARMVLNDMVYTASAGSNSALLTLVQGVISFVAGQLAKTGDLKIDTPVATMAIRGTAVQMEIEASSGVTKISLLTEPDGTVGSVVLLDRNNPSRVLTTISDARTATLVSPGAATNLSITQVTKTADDLRNESDLVRELFQVFTPGPQRRGSSDPEDTLIIPAGFMQPMDTIDPSQFAVTPFIPERVVSRDLLLPFLTSAPAPISGEAVEDGPLARLDAVDVVPARAAAMPALVIVPASFPPGVTYDEASRSFSLDPSHPAYQDLGEGESMTIRVDYALLVDGNRLPASASWTVDGRNDAPVAAGDRISAVGEAGRTVLNTLTNDTDAENDALRISDWTVPSEGSVFLDASGDLVFDPGNDFGALSFGETATVSFAYTVSDPKGATDTADVILQVHGTGTFSSPYQAASASSVLDFNDQPVSLTINAPSKTTKVSADIGLLIGLGEVPQPQMNILYLIDISGSTSDPFDGHPVGDLNGDGLVDTVLDAEIASLIALTGQIRALGFSPADVSVTVIPFNGSADPADAANQAERAAAATTFTLGGTDDGAIANYLRTLNASGQTNFAGALRAANDKLQILDEGSERNFLYFLSDGNGQGALGAELAMLNDVHQARITAIGIGEGASLSGLNTIDNTGGASRLTFPDQIDISVLGSPIPSGTVSDIDVFVNGLEITGIDPEDLRITSQGLALDVSVGGLGRLIGNANDLSAAITFASGEVLAAQLTIKGALPQSSDLIL
ncbi:Ig-like domain-containing protein [Microvirga sp. GCM10011540]|uniref:Ig-like domain-containing protein n=1 Tax=Microvirga sp. GCM10011540 TaxID=3317338 RepID=UPI00360C3C68